MNKNLVLGLTAIGALAAIFGGLQLSKYLRISELKKITKANQGKKIKATLNNDIKYSFINKEGAEFNATTLKKGTYIEGIILSEDNITFSVFKKDDGELVNITPVPEQLKSLNVSNFKNIEIIA